MSKEIVPITVADLQVIEPGDAPRVRDISAGGRERDTRPLIRDNLGELRRYGDVRAIPARVRKRHGGILAQRGQCLLIVLTSSPP